MKDLQPSNIRNLALVSPHGTGKTSLAEALLFRAKVISRHGKVEEGTASVKGPAESATPSLDHVLVLALRPQGLLARR